MAKKVKCQTCDAMVEAPGMFCSATLDHLVCQGREFIPGCGRLLAPEERHYYGAACEACETAWSDHMDDWRHGRIKDAALDEKYSVRASTIQ